VRPADYLYRFLSEDDFGDSGRIKDFFALYGTVQAAAMCLGIACGLPADAGGARHLQPAVVVRDPAQHVVQGRAMSALRAHASSEPSFVAPTATSSHHLTALYGAGAGAVDARVAAGGGGALGGSGGDAGTTLCLSAVHDACQLLASRLLRPLWQRGVAAVPAGKGAPARAATMWTKGVIASVRQPLVQLLRRLEELYPTAVRSDPPPVPAPGDPAATSALALAPASGPGPRLVVRQMELQAKTQKNPDRARAIHARAAEEASVRGLYRLVSRSVQALALIDLLRGAQEDQALAVPWAGLGKASFRALVVSPAVHDKVTPTTRLVHVLPPRILSPSPPLTILSFLPLAPFPRVAGEEAPERPDNCGQQGGQGRRGGGPGGAPRRGLLRVRTHSSPAR